MKKEFKFLPKSGPSEVSLKAMQEMQDYIYESLMGKKRYRELKEKEARNTRTVKRFNQQLTTRRYP